MQINRKRLRRGAFVLSGAGTLAVLATGLIPVAAQVIGDPLGLISIGTSNSDNPNGSVLAVANGGNANGGTGAGVSTTGSASGSLVAVSGTGCANTGNTFAFAPLAVSGTGCAGGQGTTVSGTGTACGSGLIGVSLVDASCGFVALSGDGTPSGTYSVDGSGAISAEGNSFDTTNGGVTAGALGINPEELGVAYRPVDDQVQWATFEPPADVTAQKLAALASITPIVTAELAECQVSCPAGTTITTPRYTLSTCSTCPTPSKMSLAVPSSTYFQKTGYTCGPSSSEFAAWFINQSDPGEGTAEAYQGNNRWAGGSGLAGTEATHAPKSRTNWDGAGTDLGGVVHGLSVYAPRGGYWTSHQPGNLNDLMNIVVQDVAYGAQQTSGNTNPAPNEYVILDGAPNPAKKSNNDGTYLSYWSGHSSQGHYIPVHGYNLAGKGQLEFFDEFDPSNGNHAAPWGDHWVPLTEAWAFMHNGYAGNVVW